MAHSLPTLSEREQRSTIADVSKPEVAKLNRKGELIRRFRNIRMYNQTARKSGNLLDSREIRESDQKDMKHV